MIFLSKTNQKGWISFNITPMLITRTTNQQVFKKSITDCKLFWGNSTLKCLICSTFSCSSGRLPQQYTEDPTQGAEASLPLTGSSFYGTPSLSRNIWMKHKKKSEYLGATNSAFEADWHTQHLDFAQPSFLWQRTVCTAAPYFNGFLATNNKSAKSIQKKS